MACSKQIGRKIGESLGTVLEVDLPDDECEWGEFMRVRVCLDVSKPLLRGKQLSLGSTRHYWVRFFYEHLLEFYYMCGWIGHQQRDCKQDDHMELSPGILPYGQWMQDLGRRVSMPDQNGRRQPPKVVNLGVDGQDSEPQLVPKGSTMVMEVVTTASKEPLTSEVVENPLLPEVMQKLARAVIDNNVVIMAKGGVVDAGSDS